MSLCMTLIDTLKSVTRGLPGGLGAPKAGALFWSVFSEQTVHRIHGPIQYIIVIIQIDHIVRVLLQFLMIKQCVGDDF